MLQEEDRKVDNDVGGAICASFVLFGGLSILMYRPWRRRIDQKREAFRPSTILVDVKCETLDRNLSIDDSAHAEQVEHPSLHLQQV